MADNVDVTDSIRERCAAIQYFFTEFYADALHQSRIRGQALDPEGGLSGAEREGYVMDLTARLRSSRRRTTVNDFEAIAMIGKGGYGEVFLVKRKDDTAETPEVLALKKMSKEAIVQSQKEVAHLLTERNILAMQHSPWLIQLMYSFQTPHYVFMAMEYAPGGDLRTLLNKNCPFEESTARFYVAEMFRAVEDLHKHGYIHRDLKPENFLVDADGHIKLTDFGLSKGNMSTIDSKTMKSSINFSAGDFSSRTIQNCRAMFGEQRKGPRTELAFSLVGSPDYMAYEMLEGEGYGHTVDHWAVACILFEMLTGFPPFAAESIEDVFRNIFVWEESLNYGDIGNYMSDDCWGFIRAVLTSPDQRLGRNGIREIAAHVFFDGLDFESLRQQEPPMKPELADIFDVSCFDTYEGDLTLDDEADEGPGVDFRAFTYVRRP